MDCAVRCQRTMVPIVAQTRPKKSSPSELLWSLSVNKQCYIPNCSLACLVSETP